MKFRDFIPPILLPKAEERKFNPLQGIWKYQSVTGAQVVDEESILSLSAAVSCIRLLSETVGGLPITIKERTNRGSEDAKDHQATPLLKLKANRYMDALSWRKLVMVDALTQGNHYSYIERDDRARPVALVPIRPDKVTVKHDGDTVVYVYTNGKGGEKVINQDDVFHYKYLSLNGIVGVSPIEYFANGFGVGLSAQKTRKDFYDNGAHLDGILKVEGKIDDERVKNLKANWNSNYGGSGKSRTAILGSGDDYMQLGLKPEEAQYLSSQKYDKIEIATMYRVPPHMINEISEAKYSSTEQMSIEFVKYSLMPLIQAFEMEVNTKLLRESQKDFQYCKINVNGLLRGDMKARSEFYHVMKLDGNFSTNDIRALEDMNPIEGGDTYVWSMQTIPSDKAQAYADSIINKENGNKGNEISN